jgi:hypothetical protein
LKRERREELAERVGQTTGEGRATVSWWAQRLGIRDGERRDKGEGGATRKLGGGERHGGGLQQAGAFRIRV